MGNGVIKSRYSRTLPVINLFIGLLLFLFILVLGRDIFSAGYKKIEKAPPPRPLEQRTFKKRGIQDYGVILKNNPFGMSPAPLTNLSLSQGGTQSRSDITLIGTVSGAQKESFAIFSYSSGRQEMYRVGETLPGIGKLSQVGKDKVSIDGGGRLFDIPLADIIKITEVRPAEGETRPPAFVRSIGEGSYIVDQKKVQQAIENPNQLMTDARLQPNFANGKQEGYTLREVRGGGIYQSLGMQNGDVLLRINDYNISNPENALQAFTALKGMDRIQLDILRNGAKMTLTYQIR
ncbi:MAG TPA: type II secretion system protein GspC [Thermodesulfovibrionales bacterium]|nr:type II secretion system protein GspC [Thermodesulfovibrionales bacterium]